ncbi:MAG TPA: hypothetical protein VIF62_38065 [Labilithrix sp.]
MKRRHFLGAAIGAALLAACSHSAEARASAPPGTMPNGIYKVAIDPATEQTAGALRYDPRLADPHADGEPRWVVLDASDYVPLVLAEKPREAAQPDGRPLLEIALVKEHAATLEGFTRRNLGGRAAIVVDGAPFTIHKIRAIVSGGKMKITRCTDRACDVLFTKLVDSR